MKKRRGVPFALLLFLLPAHGGTVPAGTAIQVRLENRVTSSSKPGEKVEVVVIAPVMEGGFALIPQGAKLTGVVQSAQPSKPDARAEVGLLFDSLAMPDGASFKVSAKVTQVDNARELVTEEGVIQGILESETLTAQMDRAIERLANRWGRLAALLGILKGAVISKADTEITMDPGTELELALTGPLEGVTLRPIEHVAAVEEADGLYDLVNALPMRTTAEKPPKPSDLTNLMFLGSREQIDKAFHAAGWSTAAELNAASGLETMRAVVEQRGYKEAPMSILLLEGKPPDLVYQKQHNTFAKRHHLRIFLRPEKFQDREVWVCAATHDIGIDFSPENRTFIHRIDPKIDRERAKVVFDLMHAGAVEAVALVARPEAPVSSENATGDKIETDGHMAVLLMR